MGRMSYVRPTHRPQSKHESYVAPSEMRLGTALESVCLLFYSEGQLLQSVLTAVLMSATQMVKNEYVFAELRSVSTGKNLQEHPHVI